ncbi:MAG: GatB/YqeY domain-containing protein [Candidatus Staskawiczbacteria bacterium]|nr:GatB/YqeY domain-containing protein [Candidatus Staskawiczbacteria bacterium]
MLKQQIQTDVKEAMKQKNQEMVDILRMAVASINAKQTEKRYKLSKDNPAKAEEELIKESELSDDEALSVLTSEIKKRRDAIALYEQGGRPELAQKERSEIEILQKYLPEQLAPEELKKIIEESIKKIGATEIKDMGKIMADIMPMVKGKAEGSEISKIIKELLSK